MGESMHTAAAGLNAFVQASKAGKKVFYGPLYSAIDLLGIATAENPLTFQLDAQALEFFQASTGQPGQGFPNNRPLRLSETNLDGAPGQLPGGYSFLGTSVGVYLPPQLPIHLKDMLTRHATVQNERHSHVWKMGAVQFWPCAEFGHQSKSVTTTVANTEIQYGVNGAVGARRLPEGGELYFPAKEVIKFVMNTYEDVFITTDGLTWNGIAFGNPGSNAINPDDGALVYIVLEGWRFEALTA